MKTILNILDLVKTGMRLYDRWRKGRPFREYQKEMERLDEEIARKDDNFTLKILKEIL